MITICFFAEAKCLEHDQQNTYVSSLTIMEVSLGVFLRF